MKSLLQKLAVSQSTSRSFGRLFQEGHVCRKLLEERSSQPHDLLSGLENKNTSPPDLSLPGPEEVGGFSAHLSSGSRTANPIPGNNSFLRDYVQIVESKMLKLEMTVGRPRSHCGQIVGRPASMTY